MQEKEAENLQIEGEGPGAGGAVLRRVGAAEEAVLMVVFRAAATTAVGEQHGHPCMMCSSQAALCPCWPLGITCER